MDSNSEEKVLLSEVSLLLSYTEQEKGLGEDELINKVKDKYEKKISDYTVNIFERKGITEYNHCYSYCNVKIRTTCSTAVLKE